MIRLKKIASLFLICILAGIFFTGCGEEKSDHPTKIGMIQYLNASEQKMSEILQKAEEKAKIKVTNYQTIFFKNLNSMQLALLSGDIDQMSTYRCVADYLVARDAQIKILDRSSVHLKDSFCFAVRSEKVELKDSLNKALGEMKQDGTLEKLTKEYITEPDKSKDPPAFEIQHFDGAETIKVAVTGDLPPLDLVLADGTPAGFNTALLAEVGKRLQKNVETVQIESDSRAAALKADLVDVSFWAVLPEDEERPADFDAPAGTILSEPYFSDEIIHLERTE